MLVAEATPGTKVYQALSERLKLLAHPERLRILDILRRDAECVCHLEAHLGKPQPYVSQQLRLLREAGLVADERQGTNVFYRLVDEETARLLEVVLGPEEPSPRKGSGVSCSCPKCGAA
jgi:DNA-binding transcriptional ArsR family regulator